MISLYTRLAEQWDVLFPPDVERQSFLAGRFDRYNRSGRIIEVGCGTGATAAFIAGMGFQVSATDLDPEMVRISSEYKKPNLEFHIADMNETLVNSDTGSAWSILCLGNTLPHLQDGTELNNFFSEASRVLRSGGQLIIQILNYQRIKNAGTLGMPDLQGDGIVFQRSQTWDESIQKVRFSTEVSSREEREKREYLMQPIMEPEMSSLAAKSGLTLIEQGSDWDGSPVEKESSWLYLIYEKDD